MLFVGWLAGAYVQSYNLFSMGDPPQNDLLFHGLKEVGSKGAVS